MIKLSNNKNPENPSRKRGDLRSPVRAAGVCVRAERAICQMIR